MCRENGGYDVGEFCSRHLRPICLLRAVRGRLHGLFRAHTWKTEEGLEGEQMFFAKIYVREGIDY